MLPNHLLLLKDDNERALKRWLCITTWVVVRVLSDLARVFDKVEVVDCVVLKKLEGVGGGFGCLRR